MLLTTFRSLSVALFALCATAHAATIAFNTDPFAGFNVKNVQGRQIVGGELFVNFSTANEVYSFDSTAFGVTSLSFANGLASSLPTSGANVIVLETLTTTIIR